MPRFALWIGCVALIAPPEILQPAALNAACWENKLAPAHYVASSPRSGLTSALEGRRFAEAIQLIDGELKKPDVAAADYLLYLRGRANRTETLRSGTRALPES